METNGNGPMAQDQERLVFYSAVPKLSELASFKIALEIWHIHISPTAFRWFVVFPATSGTITLICGKEKYHENLEEAVKTLQLPELAKESIKNSLERIHAQMTQYIGKINAKILPKNLRDYRIDNFNPRWWVWRPNGEIDYKRTALNLLSASELTAVQKFVVMCSHRVIDDMDSIDLSLLPAKFIRDVKFKTNPLLFYWICRIKNELHKIPVRNSPSIDVLMAGHCFNDEYSWFEYFWDRLGVEDQISVAKTMFESYATAGLLKRILSKMSWYQQSRLIRDIPVGIVLNFWIGDAPECAFVVWRRISHQCTADEFGQMIKQIFFERIWSENHMNLLMKFWNMAADHLKSNFSEMYNQEVVSAYHDYKWCSSNSNHTKSPAPASFDFLYLFFSAKSPESRKETMRKMKENLARYCSDSLRMIEVLKLCWPGDEELSKFRESVLKLPSTQKYALSLTNDLKFTELIRMLKIYSPNDEATRDFVKWLLESSDLNKEKFMFCHSNWIVLGEFIDRICVEEVLSLNMKKLFVSSFASKYIHRWHKVQNLPEMNKVVNSIMTVEEIRVLKQTLLEGLRKVTLSMEFWEDFKNEYFLNLAMWCLEDEAKVAQFKSDLPIDEIFDEFLRKACKCDNRSFERVCTFDRLDQCLIWYFGSVEEAKKFKVRKMHRLDNAIMRKLSKMKSFEACLKRLFDEDEKEIRKFKLEQSKQDGPSKRAKVARYS